MPESETNNPATNPPPGGPEQEEGAEATAAARAPDSAPPAAAQPQPDGQPDLAAQLAAAKAEGAANYERFMRAAADLENFRRRMVREKDELRSVVTGRVLEDIFPVLDNLSFAVTAAKQPGADVKSLLGGVEMVLAQLKGALATHGLAEINPLGQPFDPHQHEALAHEPSDTTKEEHVTKVVRTGYTLNGRLLRPASVVVSSGPVQGSKG